MTKEIRELSLASMPLVERTWLRRRQRQLVHYVRVQYPDEEIEESRRKVEEPRVTSRRPTDHKIEEPPAKTVSIKEFSPAIEESTSDVQQDIHSALASRSSSAMILRSSPLIEEPAGDLGQL